ncbi:MAG: hypothetical protein ACYSWO_30040 [Planctomycetota bacterium]|jgi:hypothetical protein
MDKDTQPEGKCPLCGKPIKAVPGAKVYHMACLYAEMKEVRERQ